MRIAPLTYPACHSIQSYWDALMMLSRLQMALFSMLLRSNNPLTLAVKLLGGVVWPLREPSSLVGHHPNQGDYLNS